MAWSCSVKGWTYLGDLFQPSWFYDSMIFPMPQALNWLFETLNSPSSCLVLASPGLHRLPPSHSILSCKVFLAMLQLCEDCAAFTRHTGLPGTVLPTASLLVEEGELPPGQSDVCCTSSAGVACRVQLACLHQDLPAREALCMEAGRTRKHGKQPRWA